MAADPLVAPYLKTVKEAHDSLEKTLGTEVDEVDAADMGAKLLLAALKSHDRRFLAGLASLTLAGALEEGGDALTPYLERLAFDIAHP